MTTASKCEPFLSPLLILGEGEGEVRRLALPTNHSSSPAERLHEVDIRLAAAPKTSPYLSSKIRRGDRNVTSGDQRGFTLIEVMVSLAVVAIALMALLGLQHQTLQSVVRASDMTTAALLAQEMMTQTETGQFPAVGVSAGNFENLHPHRYTNFRWERRVEPSAVFQDIRKVSILIHYGPRLSRTFQLTEMIRNPLAIPGQGT
jgi:general secretion pathway protein I